MHRNSIFCEAVVSVRLVMYPEALVGATRTRRVLAGHLALLLYLSAKDVRQHGQCLPAAVMVLCAEGRSSGQGSDPHSTTLLCLSNIPHEQLELVEGVH